MPTYDYQCKSCEAVFELVQPITAKPLKRHACPQCRKEREVQRLMGTGGALIFKGSGFYLTDYRSESYKKAAEADSKAATPATESKADNSAATKPAKDTAPAAAPATESPKKPRKDAAAKSRSRKH